MGWIIWKKIYFKGVEMIYKNLILFSVVVLIIIEGINIIDFYIIK